jgi:hypothetical protein
VLTPDVYGAVLNPLYRDMHAHYGVIALPCRVRDVDRNREEAGRKKHPDHRMARE